MKILFAFLLGALWLNTSVAQTKVYESKVSETQCVRITVTKSGGNATAHYEDIPYNAAIKSSIFNEISAVVEGDKLTITNQGTFWVIPFNGTLPQSMSGGSCWKYLCECSGAGVSGCKIESYLGCISCATSPHGDCTCCSLVAWLVDCPTNASGNALPIRGGFILIDANELTIN